MVYRYEYDNNLKVKIWINEFPIQECKSIEITKKKYKIKEQGEYYNSQIAIELQVPKNISNYGLLGVKYQNKMQDADIVININEYEESEYEDNMALKPDVVHQGIPEDYVSGIIKSIEKSIETNILKAGNYEFNIGAHSEAGSSVKIFFALSNILLKLILRHNITKDIVKEIIDEENF